MSSTSGCVSPNSRVRRFAAASYSRINGTDTLISNCLPPNNMKRRWDAPRRERRAETKTLVSMTIRLFILVSYAIPLLVSTYDFKLSRAHNMSGLVAHDLSGSHVYLGGEHEADGIATGAITECCVWQVERSRRTLIGEQPMNAGSGELAGRVRRWNIGTRLSGKMKSNANDFGKTWTDWPLRVPVG